MTHRQRTPVQPGDCGVVPVGGGEIEGGVSAAGLRLCSTADDGCVQ